MEKTKESNYLDTSKLQLGMIVKNYKELCALLGDEAKEGNSKKSQLKQWSKYFNYQKIGKSQKYYIIEIYSEPLDIPETKGRPPKYMNLIEEILCDYLLSEKNYTKTLTKNQWYKVLGMANSSYKSIDENSLINHNKIITKYEINDFYERSSRKFNGILTYALNSLQNRCLIHYKTEYVIVSNNGKNYDVATPYQEKEIIEAEYHVLHNILHFETLTKMYLSRKSIEYYKALNNYMYGMYGYERSYKRIKITYSEANIRDKLSKDELERKKNELNKLVYEYMNDNAKKNDEILATKYADGKISFLPYNHYNSQVALADLLIKSNDLRDEPFNDNEGDELDMLFPINNL